MHTDDQMSIDERRKYLRTMRSRYLAAARPLRSQLLTEMQAITGLHRKSLIRLLQEGELARQPRQKQRGRAYGAGLDDAVRVIAESLDYICAERLKPALPWMAEQLTAHGELGVSAEVLDQLQRVSVSTLRRILQRVRQDEPRLPRPGPEHAHRVTHGIPMRRIPWDELEPGHFEVDLVHHCGPSTTGEYVHTLQMIDVATGWSERMAVLGRSYTVLKDAFERIRVRLPFAVREVHPDNGSEFLNYHLIRYWHDLAPDIQLSRSRPYCKNDNRFVEQKNATLVRAFLGTRRLDSVVQTQALNALYEQMWRYYNLFQPVMRLIEKTSQPNPDGTLRYHRRFDQARSPLDRLCQTPALPDTTRDSLLALRHSLNPRRLRSDIYAQLAQLFTLPGAVPGQSENVYDTLATPLNLNERSHRSNIIIWLDSLAQ